VTRRICVWNGKRGGFGALAPTMRAIADHPNLELRLVVTDQHLYERFGKTMSEVAASFPIDAAIDMEQAGDGNEDRARAVGRCMVKAVDVLAEIRPDFLLVIGDRGEVFAACIAAHNMRIAIAHVQGGDVSGSLDEPVRHAITKLAHVHFPSTEASARRIVAMGEEPWRVHVVGDTHIDQLFLDAVTPAADIALKYDVSPDQPFVLVLQHSDSTEPENAAGQMAETVAAIRASGVRALLVYPCSDQGFEGIISEIERARNAPGITVHRNIPAPDFLGLQRMAACLVGNSSAGLIEAPYFRLPAVNVGDRQRGRERTGNVIDVGYRRDEILGAIDRALNDSAFRHTLGTLVPPFGDGTAYLRITEVLAATPVDTRLLTKRMTY
jgi:GDP/UDP-N,N'-diacetylbacillosamine 2-epimerase (hydrolysing)